MDISNVATVDLSDEHKVAVNLAVDIADHIALQSMDFASTLIGHAPAMRHIAVALAAAHAQVAAKVYVMHQHTAALRELTPEMAGAISEAGTDIGAGILAGLQVIGEKS